MKGTYRIRAFGELTGVTVKALLHYDRLGLLRPPRTASGHRRYSIRERELLEQILALKFLGIRLRDIRRVLEGRTSVLADLLRMQRHKLTADRDRLDHAIETIRRAEDALAAGRGSDGAVLRALASSVPGDADALRQYFTDRAWTICRHHFEGRLNPTWQAFYDEVAAALDDDPRSDRAEMLLWQNYALLNEETSGDATLQREVAEGMMRAWRDRDRWPAAVRDRVDTPGMREIRFFMHRVSQMVFLKRGPDFYARHRVEARFVA